MKSSNFRATMFSSVAGIALAIAMFLSFGHTQKALADDWCPNPPEGCASAGCFTNGVGKKTCKYFAQVNGASCHVGGACSPAPGGGGEIGPEEPINY